MAAYSGHYIDRAKVENRLSVAVVTRILDDANIGGATAEVGGPFAQLIQDAESMFEGYCRGIYDLVALRANPPGEARRLALDCFVFLAAQRFPRAVNRSWPELELSVRSELKGLRRGDTRFDAVGTPEPASNEGGYTSNGNPEDLGAPIEMTFVGKWGSF